MKKLLALLLAACMMLGTVALGDNIVQDEQPPKIVPVSVTEEGTILANVYDVQDEQIAQITEEAGVILTDVNARKDVEDETIVNRLTDSYESVMEDVHHSDVSCKLHEHDVKVDINMVLGSLGQELDAHDLVMYALFDVQFGEGVEALLKDESYVQLTLELEPWQPMPLIVLFSENGADWEVIPFDSKAASQITLDLYASGTVALLCDGHGVMGIGEEPEDTKTPGSTEEEEESGNFTPSATGKPAPELEIIVEEEEEYVGVIGNDNNDEKVLVPNRNYVLVTSLLESPANYDVQTYEHLHWAYDTIVEAADVGDLPADSHEGTIAADLDAVLQQMGLDLTHENLIVKDLFEVTAYGDYVHYLYDESYYLDLTFITDLDPSRPVVVIHSPDSVHWHIHPIEEAMVHEDGRITLHMYDLGTVALLVEKPETIDLSADDLVTAP